MSSASSAAPPTGPTFSPTQILHALMLSCIFPLLQNQHTGPLDPATARAAAIELLKTFRVRDTWELFICTQIMSFGLASLDSLGLSMAPGLSPAMVLRCRGNANGLQRTSQRSRQALDEYRAASEAQRAREAALAQIPDLAEAQAEAAAQIAETERALARARARAYGPANEAPAQAAPHTATARPNPPRPASGNPTPPAAASHPAPPAPISTPGATTPSPNANGYRAAILSSTASCLAASPPAAAFLPPIPPMAPA
jgi:hypothetical protein